MDMNAQIHAGICNVNMHGQFTFTDNAAFREMVLTKFIDPSIRQVVLHMKDVDFVDSAALGMLLLAHDESVKHKKPLLLEGVVGQVRRIFEMARFDQFFKF